MLWYLGGCFFTTAICKAYYYHITCLCNTLCGVQKDWGEINRTSQVTGKALYICMAFALGIGIYDGFIGPGTGTFLIMGFIFTGFDFSYASANAKILNFTSNLASLLVFFIFRTRQYYVWSCHRGRSNYRCLFRLAFGNCEGLIFGASCILVGNDSSVVEISL